MKYMTLNKARITIQNFRFQIWISYFKRCLTSNAVLHTFKIIKSNKFLSVIFQRNLKKKNLHLKKGNADSKNILGIKKNSSFQE